VAHVELVLTETRPDRRLDVPIASFGGQGAFVAEVEAVVLAGQADVAVHSAKDLPSREGSSAMVLAAVPERARVEDALVGSRLAELRAGALIATGSARRRAQLAWLRPDLGFAELRGNIGTRLERVPPGGAIVVALAALERLGLQDQAAEVFPTSVVLPQVGQGAIALRCRCDDKATLEALASIDDLPAHRCVLAERAFLARLGGDCDTPVGALACMEGEGVAVEGLVASLDGHVLTRRREWGTDPVATGTALAEAMLVLDGAAALLSGARP
jgi:hydroxymethylbilane synthase